MYWIIAAIYVIGVGAVWYMADVASLEMKAKGEFPYDENARGCITLGLALVWPITLLIALGINFVKLMRGE